MLFRGLTVFQVLLGQRQRVNSIDHTVELALDVQLVQGLGSSKRVCKKCVFVSTAVVMLMCWYFCCMLLTVAKPHRFGHKVSGLLWRC
jgi:hypothetical protein